MLLKLNQPNPFDPTSTINPIYAPISFNVKNLERKIDILVGAWASAEALNAGYLPVSQSQYTISDSNYFDMIENQSGAFIDIGDAIDAFLLKNSSFFDGAVVIPTYLPIRPSE